VIQDEYVELIQADVDGELPADRRAELAALLLANPEARRLRDELATLAGTLARVSPAEPPAGFTDAVMAALPPATIARRRGSGGARRPVLLRYAAVFVGALLAATIALRFGFDTVPGEDASQLAGTMAPSVAAERSAPADVAQVAIGTGTATVRLYVSPAGRTVEFDLPAGAPVDAVGVEESGRVMTTDLNAMQKIPGGQYALALEGSGQPGKSLNFLFVQAGKPVQRVELEVPAIP